MAEKKSWRDYSKTYSGNKSTDNSAGEEKTASWKNYSKHYSADNAPESSWRDYATTDTGSIVGSNVVNRVNNWLQNHSTYISDYQKRFSGRKGSYEDAYVSDSADWLTSVSQRTDEYDAQRQEILSYMDQYKDYLDADWVEKIRNTLAKGRDSQLKIRDAAKKDNEYWAMFTPNEEQTAAGYTADKIYNEWQTGQKQYAEDQAYDVEAGLLELEELKKERDAYLAEQEEKRKQAQEDESFWDSLGRWLGNTPDTTIPLAGANDPISSERHTNEYDKRIAELEERIKRSKYVQGYEGFMANMDAEDYAANSQYVSTRTDVAMDDARWGFGNTMYDESKLFGDFLYDYINGNQDALDVATVNNTATDAYLLGFDKGFLKTLSKDEVGVYNALYANDKIQGTETATEFLRFIESDLKGRKRAQEQAFWAGYAKEDPVGSSVFSTLISPLKGISYLGQAADMLDDGKMEENAGYNRFSYIPSTIRSQVSTTIENSGKWGKVGSFAYNTGMSMADFLFTTAVSGGNQALSLGIMGSGAAADATLAAKDRGLDDGQAFALGTIAGLAEVAMEKISLGAWLEGDMTEGTLRYVLKNALAEGGEEAGTSAINLLADVMISGDKSEWNVAMQAYIDQGKSPQEAFGLVAAEQAAQIGLDALGGMLSGAAIGGGTYAGTSAVAGFQYGDTAKNKVEAQKLVAEGLELNPESKYVQNAKSKVEKGKNLTGMQVRNILAANQEQITSKDLKKIQTAAEKRLTDLGQTENVSEVAEIATKWATGQEITRAEKKLLTHSEYGSRVANELLPKNIASGDYSTEWAEDIGTKKVNATAYNMKSILEQMASMEHPNAYKSLESRVDTETPAKVSDTGKAVIRVTGEEIDLTSPTFKQITEDGVVFDVNGKQVSSNEIDYDSEDQGLAINSIGKIEHITPAAASALYAKVDMTKPVMAQLNGMDEAFTYGFYNYSEADLEAGLFTGNLSKEQLNDAYKLGQYVAKNTVTDKTAAIKKMRTAVDALAEKNAKEGKEAPKGKKLTITYNHGGGVVEDIATAEKKLRWLNKEQLGGVEAAKILHQMGIGTDYELFTSYYSKTLKDENGNPLEVFLNDEGQEEAAYAGVYMAADGKIRINLKAYSGTRGLTLNALSHELTHFIKTWNLEKYEAMAEFLVKSYGEHGVSMHKLVLKEQARLKGIRGKEVSYAEAYDEVVANAFNRMLEDGKVMDRIAEIRQIDKSLADKIIECIRDFINKFTKAYQKNKSLFHETEALMEMKEVFEQLQNMFAEALVEASDNFQASLIAKEAGLEVAPVEDSTQYSYQSLAEAAGFAAVENENGTRSFVRDGKAVSKVTVEDIENSPIGAFINFSLEMGDISDADAKRQKKMFADICTMACKTNDFAMTMQFVGSAVFTGMKANADKQYGTTYDFPSICTKTQAVIDAMSAKMVKLGRGLTTDEIVQLYDDVFASGNPVPCPECYVFSRWIGIGGLLDNIKKYQDYYGDMAVEDVAAEYRKMKAEVSKFAEEQGISFGKAKGALTSKLTKEFNKLTEKVEKQQNQGEKVKPADLKRLEELEPMMNTVKGMTWLENVYFADSSLKKVNPKFRVPDSVLFDLNNGEAFASQYKDAWAFRTTQGAGYGKAITPYAEARLGEGVLVTNNTTNAIKGKAQGSLDNYFLSQMGKLDKKSRDALKRARLKQKIQAFIGGQRFQSTSDARYENASDYLLAALEMQAMAGMVQCYTKVDGAVPAFSAWGFSINQSLMPLGGGLDANGNVKDTSVGGMKPEVAFENRKKHESAGTITIGVNDNHIRAMFKQLVRDFIIPYHASGGKADVVAAFRRIQEGKEAKGKAVRSTDYSRTQSDKVLSDEVLRWQGKTEAQIQRIHEIRNARIAILTGGKVNMTVVRSNRFLSALYDKLNGGEWDGVKLAKSKVESQIFPNEFWDQTVTYEESAKITKDYLEYCEDLGFLHRFSGMVPSNGKLVPVNGYNENGERVQLTDLAYKYDEKGNKTAEVEEFFWKVLTDRRMYDNNGNYLPQKVVTLNDTTTDTVTGFAKNNQGREYDKAKAEALAKKIVGGQYSSQETDLDKKRITIGMTDSERAEILQSKVITAEVYENQADQAVEREREFLESGQLGLIEAALERIADEFGVFTGYDIKDVGVKLEFSKSNLHESVSKKITPEVMAKLMPVLKTAVENAIGVESHTNRYFYDTDIVRFDNLVGGYVEGEEFIPVRFGLKHRRNGEALLYVIIDQQKVPLNKTKAEVVRIAGTQSVQPEVPRSAFKVSIADIVPFVNSGDLLRYLPNDMLTENQKQIKWDAIADTIVRTNQKNDAKYAKYIREGKLRVAKQMVKAAAKDAGYTTSGYHGSRTPGFTVVDKYSWLWLARDKAVASGYGTYNTVDSKGKPHDENGVYEMLYNLGTNLKVYADGASWGELPVTEDEYPGVYADEETGYITTNAMAEWAEMNGYDSITFVDVDDGGLTTVDVVFNPNRDVKSADPITYDDEGNIIPVSERFKSDNKDIRYSSQQTDNITDRDMLANAFETISKSSDEYEMVQDYKSNVERLNKLERELDEVNQEIRKIRFVKGEYNKEKLNVLEGKADRLAKSITKYDKMLLNMEASAPLRKVIQQERKKEAQRTKDHVKEIQQNKKVRAEQTELRHKIRKTIRDLDKILNRGNKKQNVKDDLQPLVTNALKAADILFTENYGNYDMLRNGIGATMEDHEKALVESCAKMLKDLDKMPTDGYDNFMARQEAENRLKTKMSKLKSVFARERSRLKETEVSSILGELADAYASLEDSEQSYVQGAYSEAVHNFLKNLQKEVGGTFVYDMTKDQLENVYAAYRMVLNTVRNANKMFNEELKQSREQLCNAVIEEVIKAGGVHLLGTENGSKISQFFWNNMKPIWVANRIGSDTFGKLMSGLFKGQYNFAVDIDEAKRFKLSMDKKYHPREWDAEKLYEFRSSTGKEFSLNLQQIMSLYAFSKREQAYDHLLSGGFAFEKNSTVIVEENGRKKTYIHKGATTYKLNEATLNGIINTLTAEQKAYADEMQKYLSETMGAKGNEVSMKLYGIKMFNEQFYFPLRSSGDFMEKAKAAELKKEQGQINLVNSGFTHSVKPHAKNPIILSGFMDVWAEHCNEMSMYHSMVLPMEDFRKVYNYTTVHDEKMDSASVQQTIIDAYGDEATKYIDQLYSELNAGATVDPRETPWKSLISKFKKSSVMLSASVWVQQFSSIGRAYAVIDPKYFTGTKVNSDTKLSVVDEMKKYAPVAIIKEMGGFDTGTKGSAKSYILAEKYGEGDGFFAMLKDDRHGKAERIKGLVKDEQYRGDIMGYLPTKADEKTWCTIWEASKRETKAKHPKMDVKSEEFLKLAGERFSEVIEKTQVYDSVLARSANMRSKGNFMAMATAFMAEPTTTINLIEDAIRSGNKKYLARTFGAVAVSILLNNALASIVYAMRDDDEDETFIEKYFQSFTSGMIDDLTPMSYYPFLKDIYSLFQGYDVERTDMAVFADVRDALKKAVSLLGKDTSEMDDEKLAEHYKQVNEVFMSLLDAGFSAFGVPVKNVRRDGLAIVNGIKTIGTDLSGERVTTWNSFWDNVGAAVKDTIPVYAWTKDKSKGDKLYGAIISGDKAYLERLKSTYKDDDAYQSAVRKALRENDPRIHAAAQARYEGNSDEYKRIFREIQGEGKFSFDDIMSAINTELSKLEPDNVTSDYTATGYVEAIVMGNTSEAKAMKDDIIATKMANGKTQAEAEKEFVSNVSTGIRDAYRSGLLDEAGAKNLLMEYADKDEEEAASKVSYWSFCEDNPKYDYFTEANVEDYREFAEPENISLEVYAQFINGTKGLAEIKDEWGDVEVTKREQVLEVIDSLPLTWEQKDALYLAYGYAESKIWDVPW